MLFAVLEVMTRSVGCVVGMNGTPLGEDYQGKGVSVNRTVNEWVLPKENKLDIFLFWPPARDFEPRTAQARLRVSVVDVKDGTPVGTEEIFTWTWPLPGLPEGYPFILSQPIKIPIQPATELWNRAQPVESVSEADQRQIITLLEQFLAALRAQDHTRLYELSILKFQDKGRADGHSADVMRQVALEGYAELTSGNLVSMRELDVDRLVFDPVAGGLAVRVSYGRGQPPIVVETAEERRSVDVYVAKVDGSWVIVR